MKHAPISRQHYDLYVKYNGQDSEISDLLGECGENSGADVDPTPLDPIEGKKTLRSLLRVDFVDAQRNIDDENATRSNKLSEAFAAYYQRNLEQAEAAEEAVAVIEQNNQNLTDHYRQHFQPLMGIIADLGLPSHNDRAMKI